MELILVYGFTASSATAVLLEVRQQVPSGRVLVMRWWEPCLTNSARVFTRETLIALAINNNSVVQLTKCES